MGIEFGITFTDVETVAEHARRLEELGFDVVGCGEHVSFYGPIGNTFVSLGVAAGATERIKLLASIVLLPLYPAALAAKMGAALDVASGGRYLFGIGVGGELPREFEACGVPVSERGARANEALEVITRLWTEDRVTFEGRFNTLHDVSIQPKPTQQPHPPILVSGRSDAAVRRAARFGDGWIPYMYTAEMLAASIDKIRAWSVEHGRPADAVRPAISTIGACDPDPARAKDMAATFLGNLYQQDFSQLVDKYTIIGTPEQCRARVQEYVDAGAEAVYLTPGCPPDEVARIEEVFAKEVMAAFR